MCNISQLFSNCKMKYIDAFFIYTAFVNAGRITEIIVKCSVYLHHSFYFLFCIAKAVCNINTKQYHENNACDK